MVHAEEYSTVLRLLLRFFDVDSGRILIDGKDVRSLTQRSLRKHIGVVAQDTVRWRIFLILSTFNDSSSTITLTFTRPNLRRCFSSPKLTFTVGAQVLFNSTLRDNISYGKKDASDVEIMSVARSAALGPYIESLSKGLDTEVGERGIRLSGGERQRVGCARCIMKTPSIVLLDEATSALVRLHPQKNYHCQMCLFSLPFPTK